VLGLNYYNYAKRRRGDIAYLKARLQKLFGFLQNGDYDRLQALLAEAETILKKYEVGKMKKSRCENCGKASMRSVMLSDGKIRKECSSCGHTVQTGSEFVL
jgi:ribosomal protein S27AE